MRATTVVFAATLTMGAAMGQAPQPGIQPPPPAIDIRIPLGKSHDFVPGPLIPDASGYISQLAGRIASQAGVKLPLAVDIVDSSEVRAALSPGGALRITSGMIARSQTEAELAGILSHMMAHAAPVQSICALSGIRGSARRESECTARAVGYLEATGYDPLEMLTFLSRLRYEEPSLAKVFVLDDLLALRTRVEESPAPQSGYILSSSTFDRVRNGFDRIAERTALLGTLNRPQLRHGQ